MSTLTIIGQEMMSIFSRIIGSQKIQVRRQTMQTILAGLPHSIHGTARPLQLHPLFGSKTVRSWVMETLTPRYRPHQPQPFLLQLHLTHLPLHGQGTVSTTTPFISTTTSFSFRSRIPLHHLSQPRTLRATHIRLR